jgi:large subunit ribosomal protein L25
MQELIIEAERREAKEKVSNVRKSGMIPAVIYNHGNTEHLKVNEKVIQKMFSTGISESQLIDLKIGDKSEKIFIKDYQVDPVSSKVLHLDFFRITYGEKIKTHIPIHIEGKSIGEKEGGILEVFLHEIELEILPKDLMPSITVDINNLKMNEGIHVNDLKLPESARILVEGNPIICHIALPTVAKSGDEETTGTSSESTAASQK